MAVAWQFAAPRSGSQRPGVRPGLLLAWLCHSALPAVAQQPPADTRPWPVDVAHLAKWPALAATGLLLARGLGESRAADRWRDSLAAACAGLDPCPRDRAGRYLLPAAEGASQAALDADGRARTWIRAGEFALVASGAMFLLDLVHRHGGPQNIPFTPFTVYAAPPRIGVTAPF